MQIIKKNFFELISIEKYFKAKDAGYKKKFFLNFQQEEVAENVDDYVID